MNTVPNVWQLSRDAGRFSELNAFPEDWTAYSKKLRKALWKLMGVEYDKKLPLDLEVVNSFVHEGVTLRNVIYQTRPGIYTTATIYLPEGHGPYPGVVNMHGHWIQGRLAARVQSRGFTLAKKGYVVISPDAFGSGERSTVHTVYEHHGRIFGSNAFNIGETLMGCLLVDNMRAVDVLCALPEVDASCIGATGASGGGNQTMYLAAMDERVKAAVPVCSVGSYESYLYEPNCCCETLPGGLNVTEMGGILALAAPRAMMICTGLYDVKTFSPQEMLRSYEAALPVFKKLGAWENFTYRIFNHGHAYSPEARQAMLGFFELHLKGKGHGLPIEEEPFTTLDEDKLLAFAPGQRPEKVVSYAGYLIDKGRGALEKLYAETAFDPEAKKKALAETVKFDAGLQVKSSDRFESMQGWNRWQLNLSDGTALPIVWKKGQGDITIFTHIDGKKEVPETAVNAAIEDGNMVVLLDLSCQGEFIFEHERPVPYHQSSRRQLWLGKTLTGVWSSELSAVSAFFAAEFPEKRVTLHGWKETALAGLYASIFSTVVNKVVLEDAPISYCFEKQSAFFSMALVVPGILKWGDVPLAAALSDAEQVWITPRTLAGDETALPDGKIEFFKQHFTGDKK